MLVNAKRFMVPLLLELALRATQPRSWILSSTHLNSTGSYDVYIRSMLDLKQSHPYLFYWPKVLTVWLVTSRHSSNSKTRSYLTRLLRVLACNAVTHKSKIQRGACSKPHINLLPAVLSYYNSSVTSARLELPKNTFLNHEVRFLNMFSMDIYYVVYDVSLWTNVWEELSQSWRKAWRHSEVTWLDR